jgi:hypothetical protein
LPDVRPAHMTVSLMNQPTPPYNGPGASLYGPRGPQRAHNTGRHHDGPPASIADHIDQAVARVQGLSPKQRLAVHNEMVRLCRDFDFMKRVAAQVRGPGPDELAIHGSDEGRPL